MDREMLSWINGIMESTGDAINRLAKGALSSKDRLMLAKMLGETQEEIAGEELSDNMLKINEGLAAIQNIIFDVKNEAARENLNAAMANIKNALRDEEKLNYVAEAFQLDIKSVIPLMEQLQEKQEEVRLCFQKAVDIDYSLHEKPSELILQALEAYHYEISNKEVVAVKTVQPEKEAADIENPKEIEPKKTLREARLGIPDAEKREYLHIGSNNRDEFNKTIKFLKEKGGHFDPEVKTWYIEPDKITRAEMNEHKMGEYLQIAPQGKEQFKDTLSFLKENKARFDKNRGSWYLTPESNDKKIKDYLNKQSTGKKSVLSKLGQNKGKIEKGENAVQKERNEKLR